MIDEPALTPDGDSEADHDAEPEEPELQPLSFAALDAALESDSVEKTIGNTEYTSDDEISGEEISRSHSYIKEK